MIYKLISRCKRKCSLWNVFVESPSILAIVGFMARPRGLTPEENEHVCDAVQRLIDEHGSQTAVAAVLMMPDGSSVSQAVVSLAQRRQAVGVTFARSVAQHLGMSLEELVSGATGRADGKLRYRELAGWDEAAAEVIAEQLAPKHAVVAVGDSLVAFPVRRADAALVCDLAMLWFKHAPLDVRKAAEKAMMIADEAAAQEEERRVAKVMKSGTRVREDAAEVAGGPRSRRLRR